MGTFIVGVMIAGAAGFAAYKLYKDHKNGKSCANCPEQCACNKSNRKEKNI